MYATLPLADHHNQGQCIPKISMVLWKKLVLCLIYFKQSKWRTQSYRVVEYIQLSIKEKKVQISGIHNTVKQIKSFILFSISLAISKMWFTMSQLKENPWYNILRMNDPILFYYVKDSGLLKCTLLYSPPSLAAIQTHHRIPAPTGTFASITTPSSHLCNWRQYQLFNTTNPFMESNSK